LTGSTSPINIDVRLRRELLRQVFVNICFAIIVSVVVVCAAIVALSYMRSEPGARTGVVATAVLTACTINFVLTLLMIVKRMFFLLDKELERTNPQRKNVA
jgi:formate hydrogenlyase subunit 3/multisubunit Na+/H+ antiporter MnhD subunit